MVLYRNMHKWGLFAVLMLGCVAALGLDTNSASDEIPPLRPPRPELAPTFWEEHGLATCVGGALGLTMMAALAWIVLRPRQETVLPPEEVARQELEALRRQPADAKLLIHVSHIIRKYLIGAFELPQEEMTTAEFCLAVEAKQKVGPDLSAKTTKLLRAWDELKFSPAPPLASGNPVQEAGEIVEQGQARLAELAQAELARTRAALEGKATS